MKSLFSHDGAGRFKIPGLKFRFIIIFTFLTAFTLVSAYAQESLLDKRISISLNQVALPDALAAIAEKAGCTFSYSSTALPADRRVSIQRNDITLTAALKEVLGNSLEKLQAQGNKVLIVLKKRSGSVKGVVKTSDGKPAEYVTVTIKDIAGATVDQDGDYQLKNIPDGNYMVKASFVGLETQTREVRVEAGQTVNADFILSENGQQLNEVMVKGTRAHKVATQPSSSLRLNTPLMETPQSIVVTDQQTIKDIGALSIGDILRTASGTYAGYGAGQDIYFTIRGNEVATSRLRDGAGAGFQFSTVEDAGMIEKVETIKGPAGFMVSNTDPGGLVNVITKQPTTERIAEITAGYGSYNTMRSTIDLGGLLSKDSALTYRFNAGIQRGGDYYQFGYMHKYYLAGALKYAVDKNTEVTFEYNYTNQHQLTDGQGLPTINGKFYVLPNSFALADPNSPGVASFDQMFRLNLHHKLSEHWNLNVQAAHINGHWGGYGMYIDHMSANYDTLYRDNLHNGIDRSVYSSQVFLDGSFNTGRDISHKVMLGVDFGSIRSSNNFFDNYAGSANSIALYLPNPTYYIPSDTLKNFTPGSSNSSGNDYSAVYAQDAVTFFRKAILTVGGRFTHNVNTPGNTTAPYQVTDNKVTPRIGLTYLFNDQLSAYALYDQSFVPQTGTTFNGSAYKPLTGSDREIGIKSQLFNKVLSIGLDYYQITENNNLTSDPAHPGYSIQTGQIKNKGVEFDAVGNIIPQLRILANYAYTDAKITKDDDPTLIGLPNWGSMHNTANAFLKYTFMNNVLEGLSLGAGAQYMDKAFWGDATNYLPAYTLLEASAGYTIHKFYLNLNAYNLANKKYATYGYKISDTDWAYQPGQPVNYRLSIGVRF